MKFLSLQPFVPSGPDLQQSRELFLALGFNITWDAGDYIGFENNGCRFILQRFDNRDFAENFMLTANIENAEAFWNELNEKDLARRFGIRIAPPKQQPYGIEVNLIDLAGVCWHFVQ